MLNIALVRLCPTGAAVIPFIALLLVEEKRDASSTPPSPRERAAVRRPGALGGTSPAVVAPCRVSLGRGVRERCGRR